MLYEVFVYVATFYLIWILAFVPYLLRSARMDLFECRDRLFITHRETPEYKKFREHVNLLIRYAENVSWQRVTFDWIIFLRKNIEKKQKFPSFEDKETSDAFKESLLIIMKLLIFRSPLLMIFCSVFALCLVLHTSFYNKLRNFVKGVIYNDAQLSSSTGT